MVKSILQCKVGLMQSTAFKETNIDLFDIYDVMRSSELTLSFLGLVLNLKNNIPNVSTSKNSSNWLFRHT